jgi:hypothetical protein
LTPLLSVLLWAAVAASAGRVFDDADGLHSAGG